MDPRAVLARAPGGVNRRSDGARAGPDDARPGRACYDPLVLRAALVLGVALSLVPALPGRVAGEAPPRPFVVVLDPGHGGSNTGAAGIVEGIYEKRLTLLLGRAVARRLAREPGVEVKLTRLDDRYLTLRERVRRANLERADVFVSLHFNASPTRGQRGYETWVLTPEALDVDARALRRGDGPPRPGVAPEIAAILDDVERGAAHPWAVRLAERIQARLGDARGAEWSRGVRQGSMDVLMGPTMPAVLVEVGFIDHPVEGAELLRREARDRVAGAIAAAILEYRDLRAADR
jgi:N-acetylmuramoyl-L-alanine amidase